MPFVSNPMNALLGIRPGAKVSIINPPRGFVSKLNPLPDGVEFLVTAATGLDVILFFTYSNREIIERLPALSRAMAVTGGIWIAWPFGLDLHTGITEEFVRQAALDIGLVDNKRAELDATWRALRLVWRPKGRPEKPESKRKAPSATA